MEVQSLYACTGDFVGVHHTHATALFLKLLDDLHRYTYRYVDNSELKSPTKTDMFTDRLTGIDRMIT